MPKYNIHIKALKHGVVNVSAQDKQMAKELALEQTILASGAKWDEEQIEIVQILPNN